MKFFFHVCLQANYLHKKSFLGVIKFNILKNSRNENLIPLGGINLKNLNKLNMVNCDSIAVSSLVKGNSLKAIKHFY